MIKLLLFSFLALFYSLPSHAVTYVDVTEWRASQTINGVSVPFYNAWDFCEAKAQSYSAAWHCVTANVSFTSTNKLNQTWSYQYNTGPGTSAGSVKDAGALAYCRSPLTGPNSINSVYVCSSSEPVGPDCSDTTSVFKVRQFYTGPSFLPQSYGGCAIQAVEYLSCWKGVVTGYEYCLFMVRRTGALAASGPSSDAAPADTGTDARKPTQEIPADSTGKCPLGSVQAGVDSRDIPVCIGTGTAPKNLPSTTAPIVSKPPVSVTNADGSTTVTKETVYTNADGSTTTNKEVTTTAPDGTVTKGGSSNTSATPTGGAGVADKESDKTDLCKNNPTLSVCRNSSVSGTCGDIICTGDAVQCATLRYTAKMQCTQAKNETDTAALPSTGVGTSILGGVDPLKGQIDSAIQGTAVDMSSPNLDQAGFVAGSCFSNRTLTLGGQAVSFDFDAVCQDIQPLRYVILSCALIFSYLLVSRSVLNA